MKTALSMLSIPTDIPNFREFQEELFVSKIEETLMLGIKEAIGDNINPNDIILQNEASAWGICRHVRYKGVYIGTLRAEPTFAEGCKWDIAFTFRGSDEAPRNPQNRNGSN